MGLTERTPMPGMTLAFEELVEASCDGLKISRVEDEAGFSMPPRSRRVACSAPPAVLQALVLTEVADMDEMSVYLGRVDAEAVTTAIGYRTGSEGAIFNVATPAEHRRHGYGAAITAFATRSLFESGADLAWLQTTFYREVSTTDSDFPSGRQSHSAQPPNPQELLTSWWTSPYSPAVRAMSRLSD